MQQNQLIDSNPMHLNQATEFSLSGEQLKSFRVGQRGMNIHLVEGRAWVSYDNHDVIVEHGEKIYIPRSKYRVIISPARNHETIRYQIA